MNNLITVAQAAAARGVSRCRVYQWITDGRLVPTKIGSMSLIDPRQLDKVTDRRREKVPRRLAREYVSIAQAADLLGLSRQGVMDRIRTGKLRVYQREGCPIKLVKRRDVENSAA